MRNFPRSFLLLKDDCIVMRWGVLSRYLLALHILCHAAAIRGNSLQSSFHLLVLDYQGFSCGMVGGLMETLRNLRVPLLQGEDG